MSDELVKSTLTINNDAKYPLACLAIGFYQEESGAQYTKDAPFIKQWGDLHEKTFLNEPLTVDVMVRPEHECFWVVAWNCVYDPAVYYLVEKETFWHKFESDICKGIDDAIGVGIDALTGSPVGTVWSTAVNTAVDAIFGSISDDYKSVIENKIDSDINQISITLNEDRLTAKFSSGSDHHTNASPHSYLYQENSADDKGDGLQLVDLDN